MQEYSNSFNRCSNATNNLLWQDFLTNKSGKHDLKLITLVQEIIYWYKPQKKTDPITGNVSFCHKFSGNVWQTTYKHFKEKFGFSQDTIRRKFVILENLGIIKREFRTVRFCGTDFNNILFIHLSNEFYKLVTGFNKISFDEGNKEHIFFTKNKLPYPKIHASDNIDIYNTNNRSIKSNFFGDSFSGKKTKSLSEKVKNFFFSTPKTLADFYPILDKDCLELQKLSGREFTLNAMNEILLHMSKKLDMRKFPSKEAFIKYMAKVFAFEKRDACKISSENFRIKANIREEEITSRQKEQYLEQIENSKETDEEWQLKKKLSAKLITDTAYDLLRSYRSLKIENDNCFLLLSKSVSLKHYERNIIEREVRSIYAREELILQIKVLGGGIRFWNKTRSRDEKNGGVAYDKKGSEPNLGQGIWREIRQEFIRESGYNGSLMDKNWLSKLEATEDRENKVVKLVSPTEFVRDWIMSRYLQDLEVIGRKFGFSIVFRG